MHRGTCSACRSGKPTNARPRLLERFGLAEKRDEYPDRLSGGQQQRVAIVRALAMQPELMLFDEVTSALDPELVAEVLAVIGELAAAGMTMVIATHEMSFARDIADQVCFLDDGRILEQGPPDEIFSSPREAADAAVPAAHHRGEAAVSDASTLPFAWYTDEETAPPRARPDLRARLAVRGPGKRGCRARFVPGDRRRGHSGARDPRRRRDAARLHQRLPPPRRRARRRLRSRSSIQCHYHAWTYGLDGALRAAPRADREPGFDNDDWSLLPASVDTWGPFLFVNPDPAACPLAEQLGELPAILGRDVDIDSLVFHSRVEFGADANWKIVAENFLECYHCATAHPAFSDEVDVHPDRYVLEAHPTFGAAVLQVEGDGRARPVPPALPEHRHQRLPRPGRTCRSGRSCPNGPSRTERYLDYFFAPDVDEEWLREFFAFDDQVGREDRALVESVQRGMASGHARPRPPAAERGAAPGRVPGLDPRPARRDRSRAERAASRRRARAAPPSSSITRRATSEPRSF